MSQKLFITLVSIGIVMIFLMPVVGWPWALVPFSVGVVACGYGIFRTNRALKERKNEE